MILDLVYAAYGQELPDRSSFRSDSLISFRKVLKTYKSWGRFVTAYNNYLDSKESAPIIDNTIVYEPKEGGLTVETE